MITVDAVATAAMVRFGNDAELDVTEIDELELQTNVFQIFFNPEKVQKLNTKNRVSSNNFCMRQSNYRKEKTQIKFNAIHISQLLKSF